MNNRIAHILSGIALCVALPVSLSAQDKVQINGSIQTNNLIPIADKKAGETTVDRFNSNTYIDLNATYKSFSAGARLEVHPKPLPGFEDDFAGQGITNYYLSGNFKHISFTLGDLYDQFGSGFVLRTYEDRALGIDNSLRGGRIVLNPVSGLSMKALMGRQRDYFRRYIGREKEQQYKRRSDWVGGADLELRVEDLIPTLREKEIGLMIGASYVVKRDTVNSTSFKDPLTGELIYNYPYANGAKEYVGAWDVRGRASIRDFSIMAEYARHQGDPIMGNRNISKPGETFFLTTSYIGTNYSVLLQARRSDNMLFVSDRQTEKQLARMINYLPPFTQQQTYALLALYPYATQPLGEWAYQLEARYRFMSGTSLGGKYGTALKLNASYIRDIARDFVDPKVTSIYRLFPSGPTMGYTSSFFKWGEDTLFADINLEMYKKWSKRFETTLAYAYQQYNYEAGHGSASKSGDKMVHSHIFIFDGKYKFRPRTILRSELQYLTTRQDEKDWLSASLELSVQDFVFSLSDMVNVGSTGSHYYMGGITYINGAHNIQAMYGHTRAGANCSGGICRVVPAMKGAFINYTYNF